jgi:hypothetical protein
VARALKGQGLHHFAAFLDSRWREHDMVLGRLQGAECLIRALVPPNAADELVRDAHDRIFAAYAKQLDIEPEPENARAWFSDYKLSRDPSPEPTGTLKRATPMISTIVADILNKRSEAAASAWDVLRRMLPDRPGGMRAVLRVLWLVRRTWPEPVAAFTAFLLGLFAAGILIAVFFSGGWRALGIVIAGAAFVTAVVIIVGLWTIARAVRTFVTRKVHAFMKT